MQETKSDSVCATVLVLPRVHACDGLCIFDVVPNSHPSFRAMMRHEMLEQLKSKILDIHGEGITITQDDTQEADTFLATITLEYTPGYFNVERPHTDFVLWIEGLWRKGLADFHATKREYIRAKSQC